MLIPIRTTSVYNQSPLLNCGLVAVTIMVSLLAMPSLLSGAPEPWIEAMILSGVSLSGLFGHLFLHGGLLHLAGNMLFLWVFGNAVCAKTGWLRFLPVYLICGLGAAFSQLAVSDGSAIGASGAINGIVGFYLVLQPVNSIEMMFIFFLRAKRFSIPGFWVILYWLAWDIWGLLSPGASNVAFAAHIGGFATGVVLGFFFVLFKQVEMDEYDNPTLLEYLHLVPENHCTVFVEKSQPRVNYTPPPYATHRPAPLPPLPVPSLPSTGNMFKFSCPHCGQHLEIELDSDSTGSSFECPVCNKAIHLTS